VLTHPAWVAVAGLRHGFLDRRDSAGEDWSAIVARVGAPVPVALPRQVHGTRVVRGEVGQRPEADGLAVARPGLAVGVVTADCMPVLLVDRGRRVAAAVHAGWRGTAAGVLEAALAHLATVHGSAPADIEAVIGPTIGGCCYEVGSEVRDAFRGRSGAVTDPAWDDRPSRPHVDLRTAARCLLVAAGVRAVDVLGPCTACGDGWHSYRRDGAATGRQLSFVAWV
jgi:YfiH family protein